MKQKLTKDIDTVSVTYKTKDYSQFKLLDGNRNAYDPQVTRLIKSIEKRDLLHQNPVLVNDKMEIIDGQHRLLAAQALGRPIYYRIESGANLEDTIMLNANNRKWGTDDYLISYLKLKKPEYQKVEAFKNEFKISTHLAITLLGGLNKRNVMISFRDGTFTIADFPLAESIASLMVELRTLNVDGAWHDRDLAAALVHLLEVVDPKILLEKMKQHNILLTRRMSMKEYLAQFEEILNFENNGSVVKLL